MPSKHAAFVQYVADDLLSDLKPIKIRPMFGGHGLYHDGVFFGLEAEGKIYFKVNASNQKDYEDAGSEPFKYSMKDKKAITMSYWVVPDDVLEDREWAVEWAAKAIKAAKAGKKKK